MNLLESLGSTEKVADYFKKMATEKKWGYLFFDTIIILILISVIIIGIIVDVRTIFPSTSLSEQGTAKNVAAKDNAKIFENSGNGTMNINIYSDQAVSENPTSTISKSVFDRPFEMLQPVLSLDKPNLPDAFAFVSKPSEKKEDDLFHTEFIFGITSVPGVKEPILENVIPSLGMSCIPPLYFGAGTIVGGQFAGKIMYMHLSQCISKEPFTRESSYKFDMGYSYWKM